MRDSGGHGGSSIPEINVPLVFLASSCDQTEESYNQIDLPATLSVLFGLPIPASSVGAIIPNLLTELSMEQKLFAYFYNGERLLQKLIKLNGIAAIETEGSLEILENNMIFFEKFEHFCNSFATEFYTRFAEARKAHKRFLQRTDTNEQLLISKIAERNYIISSQIMSQKLAASFVNFDLISIAVGLFCLTTVRPYFTIFPPSMDINHENRFE